MREVKRSEPVKLPVPEWRTINLDRENLELPQLDEAVWASESPFIVKASGVEHTSRFSYHRRIIDRPIYCAGDAKGYAALHLEHSSSGILIENPFRIKSARKTCKLTFLTASSYWPQEGLAIPWSEVQLWLPVSVTALADGDQGERRRLRLRKEVGLYSELAETARCQFRLLVIERPGYPPVARSRYRDYLTDLPCTVEIVTRARRENLLLLKRHEVCLGGCDETLLDALIWRFLDCATNVTVAGMAESLSISDGKLVETVLHASFYGVLCFDLEQPFSIASSLFSLSPDWQANLMMRRSPGDRVAA
ncbi:MAG TPA: hypothetical protein VF952_01515 [Chloroflexia bacterium]|jgi:hypothetical protein